MVADDDTAPDARAKARIFISYSRKDMAFADRIEAALKARGFEPLIDRQDIYAFEDWWQRIEALIGRADTVVFVLSPDAVASEVALKEVACAAALHKRFAPVVCRPVDDAAVPEPLRRLNFIFFDDPARFEASADALAAALQTDIGWIRRHTEFGEIARRWAAAGRPSGLLLRSPALEEAEHWIATRPRDAPEAGETTAAFIGQSRRGATRRRNILTGSLAGGLVVAVLLAGLAYWQRSVAVTARAQADQNFTTAKQTVDGLIFNIAQGLKGVAGVNVETIRKILGTVQSTVDQLIKTAPDDPQLLRSREVMFTNFTDTYMAAGDVRDAAAAAEQGLAIARRLAAENQASTLAQLDLAVSLDRTGDVKRASGDLRGALAAYQEGLDTRRKLAGRSDYKAAVRRDTSISLVAIGDVKLKSGDIAGALLAEQEAVSIDRAWAAEAPDDPQAQHSVASDLERLGLAKVFSGDLPGALAAFQESLDLHRKLAARDQSNADAQRNVEITLNHLGDVQQRQGNGAAALVSFQESVDIARRLAAQDRGNARAQSDVAVMLTLLGDAKAGTDDKAGALAAYQEALGVFRRLAAADQGDMEIRRGLEVELQRVGDAELANGEAAGARAAYQESLDISRKLAAADQNNAEVQRDITLQLGRLGDLLLNEGNRAGALAYFQEDLDISRRRAAQNKDDAMAQTDLAISLYKWSTAAPPAQTRAALIEAQSIVSKLEAENKLAAQDNYLVEELRAALAKLN